MDGKLGGTTDTTHIRPFFIGMVCVFILSKIGYAMIRTWAMLNGLYREGRLGWELPNTKNLLTTLEQYW